MLAISCAEMKAMDNYSIDKIGIPSIVLMENAALKVIKNINLLNTNSYTVVCAPGNNGGDGLAITRHLVLKDKKVDLFIVGDLSAATTDFQINLNILKNMKVDFTHVINTDRLCKLEKAIRHNDLTIDAIFGIGLNRVVGGIFYKVIDTINQYSNKILSIDIPSGLNGDSGEVLGISIKADKTICFHQMKKGLVNKKYYTGDVIVEDIGIPKSVTALILSQK